MVKAKSGWSSPPFPGAALEINHSRVVPHLPSIIGQTSARSPYLKPREIRVGQNQATMETQRIAIGKAGNPADFKIWSTLLGYRSSFEIQKPPKKIYFHLFSIPETYLKHT